MNATAQGLNNYGFNPFTNFGAQPLGAPTGAPLGVATPSAVASNFSGDRSALSAESQMLQSTIAAQNEVVHELMAAFTNALLGNGGSGGTSGASQGASIQSPIGAGAANGNSASFAPTGGGGTSGAGATSGAESSAGTGSASKAVDIAKQYMGQKSGTINGMKNFSHAGGMTNNCADFVSACLANAGVYKKKEGDASVATLKSHLKEDGWKTVAKGQSKPGDVAIFNGSQHVELVSEAGGKNHIGSNNGGKSEQTIGEDKGTWGSVEYLSKG